MIQNKPFREVIPNHNDGGGYDFRKHIPDGKDIDAEPHDQLVQAEAHERSDDEKDHLGGALVFHMKDHVNAKDIIHHQGNGEGDRGGYERIQSAVFRQGKEQAVFQKEAAAADGQKAEDFPEAIHRREDF